MSNAIIKACSVETTVKNTGKECDIAIVAAAMLIAMDKTVTFTLDDLKEPVPWLTNLIQQRKAFPLFGFEAPIRNILPESESDLIVTLDDGLKVFMRYGMNTETYETTAGGLCYAQALSSFLNSGLGLIRIDQQGQFMCRKNNDGTMSALKAEFMYSPGPKMPDFKTNPYLNRFQVSMNPLEIVNNGVVLKNAYSLLSMTGLIDSVVTQEGTASTTKLIIGVSTSCKGTDLVALFGANLAKVACFVVEDTTTDLPVSITAAALVSGKIELTGTFVSARKYSVFGATPAVWAAQTPALLGYDASRTGGGECFITIP